MRLRQFARASTGRRALLARSWARRAEVEFANLSALRGLGREKEYVSRVDAFVAAHPDDPLAERALDELVAAARDERADLIAPLIACARARCTEGETVAALQDVFGTWREAASF